MKDIFTVEPILSKPVSMRVGVDTLKQIEKVAKDHNITTCKVCRLIIEDFFKDNKDIDK